MTNHEFSYELDFSKVKSVFLVVKPVDLRKGIDGYVSIVQNDLNLNPIDGSMFFFINRQKIKSKGFSITETAGGSSIGDFLALLFLGLLFTILLILK